MVSAEYAVAWSTPVDWPEISEQLPVDDQTLYRRVWASRVDGAAIFSDSPPDFPNGLRLLTLTVEPEEAAPFPPPDSITRYHHWVQGRDVYFYERVGSEVEPFTLRLGLALVRSPQQFNLTLDCLIPPGESAYQEALCRDTWDNVTSPFGLCPRPLAPSSEPETWQSVSDAYYGYTIEVPGSWLVEPGPTGDRLDIASNPEATDLHHNCALPDGVMGIDFAAGSEYDFSASQEGGGPELEGWTETTINGYQVWIRKARGGDANMPDSSPSIMVIQAYIRGPQFLYLLSSRCRPPTGADEAGQVAYHAQCEETFNQILERFQVLTPQ